MESIKRLETIIPEIEMDPINTAKTKRIESFQQEINQYFESIQIQLELKKKELVNYIQNLQSTKNKHPFTVETVSYLQSNKKLLQENFKKLELMLTSKKITENNKNQQIMAIHNDSQEIIKQCVNRTLYYKQTANNIINQNQNNNSSCFELKMEIKRDLLQDIQSGIKIISNNHRIPKQQFIQNAIQTVNENEYKSHINSLQLNPTENTKSKLNRTNKYQHLQTKISDNMLNDNTKTPINKKRTLDKMFVNAKSYNTVNTKRQRFST